MQSHDDNDAPIPAALLKLFYNPAERLARLRDAAEEMTLKRQNLITAGDIGEDVLYDDTHKGIHVRMLPTDPNCAVRVSIGGDGPDSNYLVIRGGWDAAIDLLRLAQRAAERARATARKEKP